MAGFKLIYSTYHGVIWRVLTTYATGRPVARLRTTRVDDVGSQTGCARNANHSLRDAAAAAAAAARKM